MTAMAMGMKELMMKESKPITGTEETLSEFLMRTIIEDKEQKDTSISYNFHNN